MWSQSEDQAKTRAVYKIMEEENIAVPSSESLMEETKVETPSEETKTETPTEPVEPTEPVVPTVELFDLPDGRKVDGVTLAKEWKENFLPDYTRKSQELAKVKNPETLPDKQPKENPYADPAYVPTNYEEIIKVAEERALQTLEQREQAKVEYQQNLENAVVSQLEEVKKVDPTINENALFLHATKYGFQDLKLAHQNMKDMADAIKKTQTVTAANIAKRTDPVSTTPGAGGQKLNPDDFRSARDYLAALKGTG